MLTVLILASVLSLALLLTGAVIKDLRLSFNFKNSAKVFYAADAAAEKCIYGARKAAGNCQNVGGVEIISFSNGTQATATRTSASVIDAVGSLGVVQRAIKAQGAFATGVSFVISPNSGIIDTTVSGITITGTGFVNGATVKLRRSGYADVLPSTPFTFFDATKLQNGAFNLTGIATGAWDVVIINPSGIAAVLAGGFTVSTMQVTSITPNSGSNNATVNIPSVNGAGFLSGATVKLSKSGQADILSSPAFAFVSGNLLSNGAFNLAGAAEGFWDVVVTNPSGRTGVLTGGFTVSNAFRGTVIREYNVPGTYTFTQGVDSPASVHSFLVEIWGAGAGGGGAFLTQGDGPTNNGGGGGGGGGYASKIITLTDGQAVSLTVGAGGAGGTGWNSGLAGGASIFNGGPVTVNGGSGGAGPSSGAGGAGGTAAGGDTNIRGNNGSAQLNGIGGAGGAGIVMNGATAGSGGTGASDNNHCGWDCYSVVYPLAGAGGAAGKLKFTAN